MNDLQREAAEDGRRYRRRVLTIVVLIAGLAVAQTAYALTIGDRFLLKDAIDWAYDVVLWLVAFSVFGRGRKAEDAAALAVGLVMLIAGAHTGYDLWDKIEIGRRAGAWVAGWSAFTAIALALFVLALMLRFRLSGNPLVAATWLAARNDAISTTGFAGIGLAARSHPAQWPEILLDLVVIALSLQAFAAILRSIVRDWGRARCDNGQADAGVASSAPETRFSE